MGESIPGPSQGPVAIYLCYFCGAEHAAKIRYCAQCKRYQPEGSVPEEARTVVPCRVCRELIPRGAFKCNQCSAFQRGFGDWLPSWAAVISALSTLCALGLLIFNAYVNRPRAPRSETDLEIIDYEQRDLHVRVTNAGNKPAFVGQGWFKLDSNCDSWRQRSESLCSSLAAGSPSEVLKLKANPLKEGLIVPGPKIVTFHHKDDFDPAPASCGEIDRGPEQLKICLAFEVIEYQKSTRRCLVREIANLSDANYLQFAKKACGK